MRGLRIIACLGAAVLLSGCGRQMVVGTWTADKGDGANNPIARATFCGDGTFTAEAEYSGGKTHAMSGTYDVCCDKITLTSDGTKREYGVKVQGATMTMMHNGKAAKMTRMAGAKM